MPNPQLLKKRLKTVRNIAKITKSMQLVAVSKMQKYQSITSNVNQYMDELLGLLHTLHVDEIPKRFAQYFQTNNSTEHTADTQLLILLAPTRGFTGVLIANYIHTIKRFLNVPAQRNTLVIGLHRKAHDIAKSLGISVSFEYPKELTSITPENIEDFFNYIMQIRKQTRINTTYICYPRFINIFTYKIKIEQYLPIPTLITDHTKSNIAQSLARQSTQPDTPTVTQEYILEPTKESVIQKILELYLEGYLTYAVANLNASEFSARMIAMKNAYDNALELQHNLMQEFNKVRQASITNMISDIIRANI